MNVITDRIWIFRDDEDKPTIGTLLAAKRLQAHMFIERIPLESVPEGEEEQKVWLRNLYVQKVRLRLIEGLSAKKAFLSFRSSSYICTLDRGRNACRDMEI